MEIILNLTRKEFQVYIRDHHRKNIKIKECIAGLVGKEIHVRKCGSGWEFPDPSLFK